MAKLIHFVMSDWFSCQTDHFLAATLYFTSFFTMAFLGATHFFYIWAVFGLDFTSFCNCILQSWHIAIMVVVTYLFFLYAGKYM